MNVLSIISAPLDTPQVSAITLAGIQHRLAPEVMQFMRQRGSAPIRLWCLVNGLANARSPTSRTVRRCWRLRFWGAVRELRKAGLLFRRGPLIATAKFAPTPRPRTPTRGASLRLKDGRHLSLVGGALPSNSGGSNPVIKPTHCADETGTPLQPESSDSRARTSELTSETRSAPSLEIVSAAARTLARLPRNKPRKYTGWLYGEHCWRDRLVVLPDGEVAPIIWCSRGRILLRNYREMEFRDYLLWAARREREVQFHKCPEAVALGLRKRGVKESPSEVKKVTARLNGARPCHPGRRRGRPRKPVPYTWSGG